MSESEVQKEDVDVLESWKRRLKEDSKLFDVNRYKSISYYLDQIYEQVDREIFSLNNKTSKKFIRKTKNKEVLRFIETFRAKYLKSLEVEIEAIPTPQQRKQIRFLLNKLDDMGTTDDHYIDWIFDVLVIDNPKLAPPTWGVIISLFCIDNYKFGCRDEIKRIKKEKMDSRKRDDLIRRARVIIRKSSDEAASKIKLWLEEHQSGNITLIELNERIIGAEEAIKKNEEVSSET